MAPEGNDRFETPAGEPIHVVATTLVGTRDALAAALALAQATNSRVYVFATAPLAGGAVEAADSAGALARDIRGLPGVSAPQVDVLSVVCNRPTDVYPLLPPGALVLVGGNSGRWWPSAEQRTARAFTRLGCRVVFVRARATEPPTSPAPAASGRQFPSLPRRAAATGDQ